MSILFIRPPCLLPFQLQQQHSSFRAKTCTSPHDPPTTHDPRPSASVSCCVSATLPLVARYARYADTPAGETARLQVGQRPPATIAALMPQRGSRMEDGTRRRSIFWKKPISADARPPAADVQPGNGRGCGSCTGGGERWEGQGKRKKAEIKARCERTGEREGGRRI